MLKHDSIEDNEEYKEIFQKVNQEVKELLEKKNIKRQRGYVYIFDKYKQQILKKRYNIDWKTTIEMNPNISID